MRTLTGIDVVEVSYKGIPAAVIDVNFRQTSTSLSATSAPRSHRSKAARSFPLGITSLARSPLIPDWPAVA
jgi:hypothetical protein